jgi:hypothetical protein
MAVREIGGCGVGSILCWSDYREIRLGCMSPKADLHAGLGCTRYH